MLASYTQCKKVQKIGHFSESVHFSKLDIYYIVELSKNGHIFGKIAYCEIS